MPETLKLLNPRLYQQYADGLTKLMGGLHAFKESHLEEDVIHKKETILKKVRALAEVNPMLGHRGVRLGITYPEIYAMQIQAILEAACTVRARKAPRSIPRSWCRRSPRSKSSCASTARCSASTRWSN